MTFLYVCRTQFCSTAGRDAIPDFLYGGNPFQDCALPLRQWVPGASHFYDRTTSRRSCSRSL